MPKQTSPQCEKQESVTVQKKQSVSQRSNMNAEQDAFEIWSKAGSAGLEKYRKGQAEHRTDFWTAGAGWYANNLRDEQLDLVSYLHHLIERIDSMQVLAEMMENEDVSLRDAATILKQLTSSNPPNKACHQSND